MEDYKKLYEQRKTRVETAIANRQPDRVPNVMRMGTLPYRLAGISNAQSLVDFEETGRATVDFYKKYPQFDIADVGAYQPAAKVLEAVGTKTMRWPGDPKGLSEDNTFQFIEFETLLEDEYDEFFNDPAGFLVRKHMPRTAEIFEPLADIDYYSMVVHGATNTLTSPKMIDTYERLLAACKENKRKAEIFGKYEQELKDLGFYTMMGAASTTAFDMLADTLRGTFGMMPDILLQRENVKRALDMFGEIHLRESIANCKALGTRYAWVMLHKGFDNFIGDKEYAELYWPYLRDWIYGLVDAGLTPVVYTEGLYNTRLKYLADVPKDKVVYHFEKVDLAEAKKVLGDRACLMGGYPINTLMYGSVEDVKNKAREVLDIMAPGGGYMFAASCTVDDVPIENLDALLETLDIYARY
jgi:hypothetical protein